MASTLSQGHIYLKERLGSVVFILGGQILNQESGDLWLKEKRNKATSNLDFFLNMRSTKQNTSMGHFGTQKEPFYIEDVIRAFHFNK